MPLPKPKPGESQIEFISRCSANPTMNEEYPDTKQRVAVCYTQWRRRKKEVNEMSTIPFKAYAKASESTAWSFSAADGNTLIKSGGPRAFAMVHALMRQGGSYTDEEKFKKADFSFPHHKDIGGAIKTVLRGCIAASNALDDACDSVQGFNASDKKDAQNHLNRHFAEFNRDDLKKALEGEILTSYLNLDRKYREHCQALLDRLEAGEKDLIEIEKTEYKCECLSCGYKMTSNKHCIDIKCPKCGSQMRREDRPGAGR